MYYELLMTWRNSLVTKACTSKVMNSQDKIHVLDEFCVQSSMVSWLVDSVMSCLFYASRLHRLVQVKALLWLILMHCSRMPHLCLGCAHIPVHWV